MRFIFYHLHSFLSFKSLTQLFLILLSFQGISQTQRGIDIPGEDPMDNAGISVSLGDPNTVAIGAPLNPGFTPNAGHVRVFQWSGNRWQQKGVDIDGINVSDEFGHSVSMAGPDRIAIGAKGGGRVYVYRWTGTSWSLYGGPFNGRSSNDYFGFAVSMPNQNAVGIGAYLQNYIRVNVYNGLTWTRRGSDINGSTGDEFGRSVSMPNSHVIAIGATKPSAAGFARIMRWDGTRWIQKGSDILGENNSDHFGFSISMPTENTLAVGAPFNDQNGSASGHARVFDWNGSAWVQRGLDIDGDSTNDRLGYSLSMQDSLTVAVGAYQATGAHYKSGIVRVFRWNGSSWVQQGSDLSGKAPHINFGRSVSMVQGSIAAGSQRGAGPFSGLTAIYDTCGITLNRQVIFSLPPTITSAQSNATYQWLDCNNNYAELVGETASFLVPPASIGSYAVEIRVGNCVDTSVCYNYNSVFVRENLQNSALKIYPNPTNGKFQIDFGDEVNSLKVVIRNILGEEVLRKEIAGTNTYEFELNGNAGLYFVELIDQSSNSRRFKVIKK